MSNDLKCWSNYHISNRLNSSINGATFAFLVGNKQFVCGQKTSEMAAGLEEDLYWQSVSSFTHTVHTPYTLKHQKSYFLWFNLNLISKVLLKLQVNKVRIGAIFCNRKWPINKVRTNQYQWRLGCEKEHSRMHQCHNNYLSSSSDKWSFSLHPFLRLTSAPICMSRSVCPYWPHI